MTAKELEERAARLARNGVVLAPGPDIPRDPAAAERNAKLIQRGYFHGSCWECQRLKEEQQVNLVRRHWRNGKFAGYVCPKHGGDDGPLESLKPVRAEPDTTTPVQPSRRDEP